MIPSTLKCRYYCAHLSSINRLSYLTDDLIWGCPNPTSIEKKGANLYKHKLDDTNPETPVLVRTEGGNSPNIFTPITTSKLILRYLSNLSIYRKDLSAWWRGFEIGIVHSYFLVGPFYVFGPMANTESNLLLSSISAFSLFLILLLGLTGYALTSSYFDSISKSSQRVYKTLFNLITYPHVPGFGITSSKLKIISKLDKILGVHGSDNYTRKDTLTPNIIKAFRNIFFKEFVIGLYFGSILGVLLAYVFLNNNSFYI